MRACKPMPGHALSAIRVYVLLLTATILVLSLSLIGYLYWHDHLRNQLDQAANLFHLEAMLYCSRIKEEMTLIPTPLTDGQIDLQRSDSQGPVYSFYSNAVYVMEKHTRAISQLHGAHGAASAHNTGLESIFRKANGQLARVKAMLKETGVTGMDTFVESGAPLLSSFMHSIEQLRRLHAIARDGINKELETLNASSTRNLLTIFTAALLLGSLVVWRIMGEIRRLVDAQRRTEHTLRQSAAVFENTSEGVLITDVDAKIIAVNKAFTLITGFSGNDVLGKNPRILKSGQHDSKFYEHMWSSLQKYGEWGGEISDRRKNGEILHKWQTISAVRDDNGRLTHYVSVFSDISHIKRSEAQLHHLAHHDALTDLPNRLLLNARLEHSLQHAHRKDTHVAVLFLDLDHFKKVNDSLGHPAGDHLLQLVAQRLLVSVREEDTVARLGGDELAIVLGSLDDDRLAGKVARGILDGFSEPFELEGQDIFMSASIGISIYPRDGQDAMTLLKNADAAMYMAKHDGRNGYRFYSNELTTGARKSLALDTSLHRALEREELLLHFQPQLSLQSGDIVGLEALVRWQHPEFGLLSPDKFIPLAEENGLIGDIGEWVLRSACKQAKAWQNDGLTPFRIAVNLSGRQLEQGDIVQVVHDVLEDTGLDPACLELELTESSVMRRAEQAVKTLDALRELGTTIAIDDFGTGYSSLSYLKRFHVDRLKIDRSFVRDIPQDANDVALARAIVALGHSLNLSVIAEGVETQEQKELLTSIGCDEMQGFLYSAPRTASEIAGLLENPDLSACVND
jgi:diguanylate cyclase (GGDEF)-like protein/PAS domain S-box-containing protein